MNNNKYIPPKLAERILLWFLKDELAEEVLGDLEEKYYQDVTQRSVWRAKLNYWLQVMHYLRPFAIKHNRSNSNYFIMYKHNFKLTYRNFLRYKSSFLINLFGLSSGIACALLISLWVVDEVNMNKFHAKDDVLYQVYLNNEESGTLRAGPASPALLGRTLKSEIPEVVGAVEDTDTEWFANNFALKANNKVYKAKGKFGGEEYFQLFSFPLKHGQPNQVLKNKKSIVISENLALKIFGTTEGVVGKTLTWQLLDEQDQVTVTGIMQTLPNATTESFEFIIPFENFIDMLGDGVHWGNYNSYTYIELAPNTNLKAFNSKIADFIKKKRPGSNVSPFATKYSDLYLHGKFENGQQVGGRILYVQLFATIAGFVLVIACINFMNLTTARASRRMKEIGVKKSLGATRKALAFQFMFETLVITTISVIIAICAVYTLLPFFNNLTAKHLSFHLNEELLLMLTGITLLTGILAGSYPALYLSGFKPLQILKGKLKGSAGEVWVRKGLVTFQFALSIIMIVGVLVVYNQLAFIQSKNLGLKRENVIKVPVEGKVVDNLEAFKMQSEQVPGVLKTSFSSHNFTASTNSTTGVWWPGKNEDVEILFEQARSYYGLISTLGIEFIAGRDFSEEYANENNKIIFNETAIKIMGLKDPIGQTVSMWGEDKEIIGVVKDFNYASLHEKINPMLFHFNTGFLPNVYIKIDGLRTQEALANLKDFYSAFNPGFPFDFTFLDSEYQKQYLTEKRISVLAQVFAGVAIIISCLGLFGLTAYTAERRQKEIGIRKVLGAPVYKIVLLLSGSFNKMVIAGVLLGLPLSYILSQNWLNNFAYRIDLNIIYFLLAGVVALLLTWVIVGYHTIHAANINPAKCLKDE